MLTWIAIAVMLGGVLLALLAALRPRPRDAVAGSDAGFYRDQLAEIDRQVSLGLLGAGEADAARAEAARRLIAAGRDEDGRRPAASGLVAARAAALFMLIGIPAVTLPLYGLLGRPTLPASPLADRDTPPSGGNIDLADAVRRIEARLAEHPEDGRGFAVIAPVYMSLGRYDDAVHGFEMALRLNGETAALQADLGEARVAQQGGIVVADARAAFERAVALDFRNLKARYYLGQAAEQDGDRDKALAIYRAMRADATEAATQARLDAEIGRLAGAPAVPPGGETVATLAPDEQARAIRGMVEGLDARLTERGGSAEEWARLVRAYAVLGEEEKSGEASSRARRALQSSVSDLARFDRLMAEPSAGKAEQ